MIVELLFVVNAFILIECKDINVGSQALSPSMYMSLYSNKNYQNEVDEVLQLLGVSESNNLNYMDKQQMAKRVGSIENIDHGVKLSGNHFKWQYIAIASVCSIAAVVGVVLASTCYYKMSKVTRDGPLAGSRSNSSNNSGIVALGGTSNGDKKLAQSAQMYHYQHQKQQMIALEKAEPGYRNEGSDDESEPDDALEDYTVYECPGMAMGDELEVKNPLYQTETNNTNEK